ncbi:DUF2878 domain-containing protein [Dyella lutea]|uniref:DUF2878 domain-containing protein n=1 Tax=Dyella lutea TaxID=2950441 RepID=A0ABT1FIX2_9GAMM|nr:DUF2878 domain-containing protein [Dyella lutea]MCP1376363.1 DUF2878 domain-containing protein [Dyella lutea]
MNAWINAITYQLVWFAAIWGASSGHWWLAPLALLPFAAWMLGRPDGGADALLMPIAVLLGAVLDSSLAASGLVAYVSPVPFVHAAPLWILSIWAAFSLTLRHSFRFLHGRPLLAAVLGGAGGPIAYLGAGRAWHAVAFPLGTTPAVIALAAGWAVAMPLLIGLATRVERTSGPRSVHGEAHVA